MSDSTNRGPQSIMTEVARRLQESEKRAANVIVMLEEQNSIQTSLDEAGKGLAEANSRVANLAESTQEAIKALAEIVSLLKETIAVIDTTALKSSLDAIDERIIQNKAEIKDLREQADRQQHELLRAVDESVARVIEGLRPRSIVEGLIGRRKD